MQSSEVEFLATPLTAWLGTGCDSVVVRGTAVTSERRTIVCARELASAHNIKLMTMKAGVVHFLKEWPIISRDDNCEVVEDIGRPGVRVRLPNGFWDAFL